MRYSGIGGQAVMEGVMMKNQEKYAVAVRKPDGEIALEVSEYKGIIKNKKIRNMPGLTRCVQFYRVVVPGCCNVDVFRISFFEEEETDQKEKTKKQREKKVLIRRAAEKTGQPDDGWYGCIFHCSCCRDIYDSSILYICIFSEVYRFLYADRCFRGADPSGNFYRVCGSDFADA